MCFSLPGFSHPSLCKCVQKTVSHFAISLKRKSGTCIDTRKVYIVVCTERSIKYVSTRVEKALFQMSEKGKNLY